MQILQNTWLLKDNNGDHITIFHQGAMNKNIVQNINLELFNQARLGVITVNTIKDNTFLQKMYWK